MKDYWCFELIGIRGSKSNRFSSILFFCLFLGLGIVLFHGRDLSASLWHNVGWVIYSNEQSSNALAERFSPLLISWLQRGLETFPNDTRIRRNLGFIYINQENEDMALDIWRPIPNFEKELVLWSQVALSQNKQNEALVWLNRALLLNPSSSVAWYYLGLLKISQAQLEQALQAFQNARLGLEADKIRSSLDFQIGFLYLLQPQSYDSGQALILFDRAIQENRFVQSWERVDSHYYLGDDFYRDGRFQDAITEFEAVITQEPKHYRAHVRLSEAIWQQSHNFELAQHHLNLAMSFQPDNKWAYKVLANILVEAGDLMKAKDLYLLVLTLDETDQTALNFLSQQP